jgi:hypothetical protein
VNQDTAVTTTTGHSTGSVPEEDFSFSANGNRDATGYTTGADNQMLAAPPPAAGQHVQYVYDPEGNTRFCIVYDQYDNILQQATYTWDYRNRLAALVFDPDGLSPTRAQVNRYAYNAADQRVPKYIDANNDDTPETTCPRWKPPASSTTAPTSPWSSTRPSDFLPFWDKKSIRRRGIILGAQDIDINKRVTPRTK